MSRIFSAIEKANGDLAEISQRILEGEVVSEPAPTPAAAEAPAPVGAAPANTSAAAPASARDSHPASLAGIATVAAHIAEGAPIFPFDGMDRRASEQYRLIRTRVLQHPGSPRVIMITSPGEGDGKTMTSTNLAAALALKSDTTVLLLEGDLRRSAVSKFLGITPTYGLAEVIEGKCTLEQAILRIEQIPNLYILPAGDARRNPSELLDSAAWRDLLVTIRASFQYVVLDSPPVGIVADYALLQAVTDGVILISRPDKTSRSGLSKALDVIPRKLLIGTVLNSVEDWFLHHSQAYYYTPDGKS